MILEKIQKSGVTNNKKEQFLRFLLTFSFIIGIPVSWIFIPAFHKAPNFPFQLRNMALNKTSSPCHQGMTPPDSPTRGTATSQTIVKDLKHLFDVFLEKVFDLANQEPPNTPVSQDQSPAAPDMIRLKQLLVKFTSDECASVGPFAATDPAQSGLANNKQEEVA